MQVKKRDQMVRLKAINKSLDGRNKVVTAQVVTWNSQDGYFAKLPDYGKDCKWKWFSPQDWEEIK